MLCDLGILSLSLDCLLGTFLFLFPRSVGNLCSSAILVLCMAPWRGSGLRVCRLEWGLGLSLGLISLPQAGSGVILPFWTDVCLISFSKSFSQQTFCVAAASQLCVCLSCLVFCCRLNISCFFKPFLHLSASYFIQTQSC